MAEWVMVNGARIERSFLEENVSEARKYDWEQMRWEKNRDHGHCMICSVAQAGGDVCYRSKGGLLCSYCFERFIARDEPT